MGPEGHESVLLDPGLAPDDPGHGLAQVVEAHHGEHPAREPKAPLDPVQQGGLGLDRVGDVQRGRGELRDEARLTDPRGAEGLRSIFNNG